MSEVGQEPSFRGTVNQDRYVRDSGRTSYGGTSPPRPWRPVFAPPIALPAAGEFTDRPPVGFHGAQVRVQGGFGNADVVHAAEHVV